MITRYYLCFVAIFTLLLSGIHLLAEDLEQSPNIGHYTIGNYEFYAEELVQPKDPKLVAGDVNFTRKRIFVLPNITLLPEATEVFDQTGESLDNIPPWPPIAGAGVTVPIKKNCGTQCSNSDCPCIRGNKAQPPTYFARISFTVSSPQLDSLSKFLIFAQYQNDPRTSLVDSIVPELQPYLTYSSLPDGELKKAVDGASSDLKPFRFEVAPPQSLSIQVTCNAKEIGKIDFPSRSYLSTLSTFSVECANLDPMTAQLILKGRFSILANMSVDLSRMQIAGGFFDLSKVGHFVANGFMSQRHEATSHSSGFLFWQSTTRSVSTFIDSQMSAQGSATSNNNASFELRDAGPVLQERALNFLFNSSEGGPNVVQDLYISHMKAAEEEEKLGHKEAAEAHRKYADYILSLKNGKDDDAKAKDALGALSALASSGGGAGGDAAASGGNPYAAVALFLVNGITWKDDSSSDKFEVRTMKTADWSSDDSRRFSGMIINQVGAGHSISQSYFPQIGVYQQIRRDLSASNQPVSKVAQILNQPIPGLPDILTSPLNLLPSSRTVSVQAVREEFTKQVAAPLAQ